MFINFMIQKGLLFLIALIIAFLALPNILIWFQAEPLYEFRNQNWEWGAISTLIAAAIATISAAAAIREARNQKEQDRQNLLKWLCLESSIIYERIKEQNQQISESQSIQKLHNLYLPSGFDHIETLVNILPEHAANIGKMRRLLKNYQARNYNKLPDKVKRDLENGRLQKEMQEFIHLWNQTFMSVSDEIEKDSQNDT